MKKLLHSGTKFSCTVDPSKTSLGNSGPFMVEIWMKQNTCLHNASGQTSVTLSADIAETEQKVHDGYNVLATCTLDELHSKDSWGALQIPSGFGFSS